MRKGFLYDTADVKCGFDYWFYKLLNYCLGIYKYENLPKSLPHREILVNLILTGHCVIFSEKGELVTTKTTLFDFDEFYRPTKATFGNPVIKSRTLNIGVDCEVVYLTHIQGNIFENQKVDSGLRTFICRYARQLADIESTANIYSVNMRATSFPVASDDVVKEQVARFFEQLQNGKREVITDSIVTDSFRTVEIAPNKTNDTLNDILIARDKILANFFQDIGVKYRQEQKKAQMSEDEIQTDEQLLMLDVKQMREIQEEGFERVNNMFGTDIKVSINPYYDREMFRGGVSNDSE